MRLMEVIIFLFVSIILFPEFCFNLTKKIEIDLENQKIRREIIMLQEEIIFEYKTKSF
mgnify:CR=1 FL=1